VPHTCVGRDKSKGNMAARVLDVTWMASPTPRAFPLQTRLPFRRMVLSLHFNAYVGPPNPSPK
ncbi:hypothetical protein Ancab_029558, partial [Ancistrocladus abbreviatus]